jgi:hypothetical protein
MQQVLTINTKLQMTFFGIYFLTSDQRILFVDFFGCSYCFAQLHFRKWSFIKQNNLKSSYINLDLFVVTVKIIIQNIFVRFWPSRPRRTPRRPAALSSRTGTVQNLRKKAHLVTTVEPTHLVNTLFQDCCLFHFF